MVSDGLNRLERLRRFESRVFPVTRSIGELSDQRSFRTTRYSVFGDRSVETLVRERGLLPRTVIFRQPEFDRIPQGL